MRMIHRTPAILPWLYPQLTWRFPEDARKLYLTFDDGPVTGPTEFVLDTLKRSASRGTFFCIGDNVRKHPEVFRRIISDGHAVGNHTYNHLNGWRTDVADYVSNTSRASEVMKAESKDSTLFRPPYGRITKKQITALKDYRIIMWDVLTMDYNSRLNAERCLRNSIAATRNGSIIVFHDSYKAEKNLTFVLPRYIDHFLERQFTFDLIDP